MLTTMKHLQERYDAYIIDLWGVVHDGVKPYPNVVECLNQLMILNKSIIFLSNAPRPSSSQISKLLEFGIQVNLDMVLTSGDAVIQQLTNYNDEVFSKLGKRIFHVGENRNKDILASLDVQLAESLEEADFMLVTAFIDEEEDQKQYDILFEQALNRGLPLICANPDKEVVSNGKVRLCSGFLAQKYEKMGGMVHYYGKPYHSVYTQAFERLFKKEIKDKKRILMIGDTLDTDIKGAINVGLDSALVLSGNTKVALKKNHDPSKTELEILTQLFDKHQIKPTWILPGF